MIIAKRPRRYEHLGVRDQYQPKIEEEDLLADISVFTLIRTDTTLDHSQKAEKV